jgi:hypothetical protein
MRVGGQLHAPAALPPGKRPGTHCIGGWVGHRVGLDDCGKSRPPPGCTLYNFVCKNDDCTITTVMLNKLIFLTIYLQAQNGSSILS